MNRSTTEKIFLFAFLPTVILIYITKSYPSLITGALGIDDPFGDAFFVFGKSPNFWYQTLYTAIVAGICLYLLLRGKSPYGNKPGRSALSTYQKAKFTSILLAQVVGFYFLPFVFPMIKSGVWTDKAPKNEITLSAPLKKIKLENPISYSPTNPKYMLLIYDSKGELIDPSKYAIVDKPSSDNSHTAQEIIFYDFLPKGTILTVSAFHLVHKMAHVYVSPAFFSFYAFAYMFIVIPIFVLVFWQKVLQLDLCLRQFSRNHRHHEMGR